MTYIVKDNDLCPCESNKIVKDCCLRKDGTLRPLQCITKVRSPKTGKSNPRCYASKLVDCSEKISREHYITHGVLKALSDKGIVDIGGLAWINDDERKKLPTPTLVSNILCERHNNALSALDNIAIRLFNTFDRIDQGFAEQINTTFRTFLFNGHDIERWMVKTLCGLVFSENASSQSGLLEGWTPSIHWLKILFGQKRFPYRWGLYFSGQIGEKNVIKRDISFNMLSNERLGVYGMIFTLKTKRFMLLMTLPPERKEGTILEHTIYRPGAIVMKEGNCEKNVFFAWNILVMEMV